MDILDALIQDNSITWIESLPTYQRNRINQLLSQGKSLEEVAAIWLSASPENIAPFGANQGDKHVFIEKIKEELEGFICGDTKYESYRSDIKKELNLTKSYVIGVISTAIAPVVGSTGIFIAPIIAILLMGIFQITINAWCSTCREQRKLTKETI